MSSLLWFFFEKFNHGTEGSSLRRIDQDLSFRISVGYSGTPIWGLSYLGIEVSHIYCDFFFLCRFF